MLNENDISNSSWNMLVTEWRKSNKKLGKNMEFETYTFDELLKFIESSKTDPDASICAVAAIECLANEIKKIHRRHDFEDLN